MRGLRARRQIPQTVSQSGLLQSVSKKKLLAGKPVIGSWIQSGSPMIAELMAATGFDFLCVDVEHSAVDLPQTQAIFQAIKSGNTSCDPFVRVHGVDYALVKRYLDAGARGMVGPLVNTRADAELLVAACKYPPAGRRGVGFCRANEYGMNLEAEFARANDEGTVVVQIEDAEAVRNIDAIFSVPGVDAAFIGPYDLTASLGITAQFSHPDFIRARQSILDACRTHGVAPGIHVTKPDPDEVARRIDEGFRLIALSLDTTMLLHSCTSSLKTLERYMR